MCRSRRELSNAYLLAKIGFDTAENEPCQVCPTGGPQGPAARAAGSLGRRSREGRTLPAQPEKKSMRTTRMGGDRFSSDKSDPSMIVFSEIKRCHHPHFTLIFSKSKRGPQPERPRRVLSKRGVSESVFLGPRSDKKRGPGRGGVGAADGQGLRRQMKNELSFPPNLEGLVLGCIDADFCK